MIERGGSSWPIGLTAGGGRRLQHHTIAQSETVEERGRRAPQAHGRVASQCGHV
jgi:hypothetical protein